MRLPGKVFVAHRTWGLASTGTSAFDHRFEVGLPDKDGMPPGTDVYVTAGALTQTCDTSTQFIVELIAVPGP